LEDRCLLDGDSDRVDATALLVAAWRVARVVLVPWRMNSPVAGNRRRRAPPGPHRGPLREPGGKHRRRWLLDGPGLRTALASLIRARNPLDLVRCVAEVNGRRWLLAAAN
jgi:hypothetical protein